LILICYYLLSFFNPIPAVMLDYTNKLEIAQSAGGHLSVLTAFHLLRTFPTTPCPTLLLHFGAYDLSFLPQCLTLGSDAAILDLPKIKRFTDSFLPNTTTAQRKDPKISPFYESLEAFRGRLPKALFTCGTADPLLDDTVMMGCKWLMGGGEAVVKIYEGAPHSFIALRGVSDEADQAAVDIENFIKEVIGEKLSEGINVLELN
jgi:acetyl esterase/lipase